MATNLAFAADGDAAALSETEQELASSPISTTTDIDSGAQKEHMNSYPAEEEGHSWGYFLNLVVFMLEGTMYTNGLEVAHQSIREQVNNQQSGGFPLEFQNVSTLVPILILSDVSSRIGGDLTSPLVQAGVSNDILGKKCGNDSAKSRYFYYGQRLTIKIMQRGGKFEHAQRTAREIYQYQKEKLESGEQESDSVERWRRLVIMADMQIQLRNFKEALSNYETARDEIVNTEPNVSYENIKYTDENTTSDFFFVQNRIIKLLIKMREYAKAMELAKELLDRQRFVFEGDNHYSVLKTIHHISVLYKYEGNYVQALKMAQTLESKLKFNKETFNDDNLYEYINGKTCHSVEINLAELGWVLSLPNDVAANLNYASVFKRTTTILGATHPATLETMINIATFLIKHCKTNDSGLTEKLLGTVYAHQMKLWGADDFDTLHTKSLLSQCPQRNEHGDNIVDKKGCCGCAIL